MGRNKVVPASVSVPDSAGQELARGFKSPISAATEWRCPQRATDKRVSLSARKGPFMVDMQPWRMRVAGCSSVGFFFERGWMVYVNETTNKCCWRGEKEARNLARVVLMNK